MKLQEENKSAGNSRLKKCGIYRFGKFIVPTKFVVH